MYIWNTHAACPKKVAHWYLVGPLFALIMEHICCGIVSTTLTLCYVTFISIQSYNNSWPRIEKMTPHAPWHSCVLMLHSFTTRARLILALPSSNMPEASGGEKIHWWDNLVIQYIQELCWLAVPRPDQLKQPQIKTLQFADWNDNFFLARQCIYSGSNNYLIPCWFCLSCWKILVLLSDNAPLLPEKCCNYKCFGIHMFIYFVCIGKTQKIWEKRPNLISFHTELQRWTGQNVWHPELNIW